MHDCAPSHKRNCASQSWGAAFSSKFSQKVALVTFPCARLHGFTQTVRRNLGRGIFPATSRLKWLLLHDLHAHLHFSCVGSHTTRVPPLGRGICPANVRINGSCHMPLRLRGLARSVRCRVLRLLQHFYCKFSHKRALVEVLPNSCLQVLA